MRNTGFSPTERRCRIHPKYLLPFAGRRRGDRVRTILEVALAILILFTAAILNGCVHIRSSEQAAISWQANSARW